MRMKPLTRTISFPAVALLLATFVLCSADRLHAQGSWGDALLHDYTERPQWIGAGLGFGYWIDDALFGVSDQALPCAVFSDGNGGGLLFEVKSIMYPFHNNWFIFSPRLRYEARSGTFITPLAGEPAKGENNETVILEQEAQVDATLGTVSLELMAGVEFFESGFYAVGGGEGGLLLSGKFDYTERLLSPQGFVYAATETNEQKLVGGRKFENFGSFVADLRGGLGYIHELGDSWALNAEFLYSYPVISALKDPDKLNQQGIMGTVSVLYNFGD